MFKHKKQNRKPKPSLLKRAFSGLDRLLHEKPDDTAYVTGKEIIEKAEIPTRTYKDNFGNVDDVIQYANEEFIDVFDMFSERVPTEAPNLSRVFLVLLSQLKGHEEAVRVVIDRFNINVMAEAMERIKPIVTYGWENRYTITARERMLEEYTYWWFQTLKEWVDEGMPREKAAEYVEKLVRLKSHAESGANDLKNIR